MSLYLNRVKLVVKTGSPVARVHESSINLAQYTARRNLQLVTATDFNLKLQERDCPQRMTVQKVCRMARNEDEIRRTLDYIWSDSENAAKILKELKEGNEDLYRFEKMLEDQGSR